MIEHSTEIRIRYAETDQMKIAHHSNYIIWFELARVELMRSLGISYARLEKNGYLMPVLEAHVNYFKALFFDDLITIRTFIKEMPRAKVKYQYEILNANHELVCHGYTLHGFMNLKNRAIKPPKIFLQTISNYFK